MPETSNVAPVDREPVDRELIAVVDPMCSWCWGFQPSLHKLAETFSATAPVSLLVGGLRPYSKTPMAEGMKDEIRHHWQHVQEASGQPFDFTFFDRDGFVYDTEPACRAVVTGRALDAGKVLGLLEAIQRGFYAEGRDVTEGTVLAELAAEAGYDGDAFRAEWESQIAKDLTRADFQASANLGVNGFPTVVARAGDSYAYACVGYRPFEALEPLVQGWINGGREAAS
ncbi:MAG: DsbA family protein [Magnetovibrionaceae bacterium]